MNKFILRKLAAFCICYILCAFIITQVDSQSGLSDASSKGSGTGDFVQVNIQIEERQSEVEVHQPILLTGNLNKLHDQFSASAPSDSAFPADTIAISNDVLFEINGFRQEEFLSKPSASDNMLENGIVDAQIPMLNDIYGSNQVRNSRLNPPAVVSRTTNSMKIEFDEFISNDASLNPVVAYDLSYKTVFDNEWTSASTSIGSQGNHLSFRQIISIRVDSGKTIPAGSTFQLAIQRENEVDIESGKKHYDGLISSDFEHLSRTPFIPYNANAQQMKDALDKITAMKVREVKRCDEFSKSSNSEIGYGGDEYWVYGCPAVSRGGYRWLVVFDIPMTSLHLPRLVVWDAKLGVNTWSGLGSQVSIVAIKQGMVNPSLCLHHKCHFEVNQLSEGTPYAFRYRALLYQSGWSDYSKASSAMATLEDRVPPRPKAPMFSSAGTSHITIELGRPLPGQNVEAALIEYKLNDDSITTWTSLPNFDMKMQTNRNRIILPVKDLKSNREYIFRYRYSNHRGWSYWSATSTFSTTNNVENSNTPLPPVVDETSITSRSFDVKVASNPQAEVGSTTYRVQYKADRETNWHNIPETIVFNSKTRGVEVQEIISRSDNGQGQCVGSFWLRLGLVDSTDFDNSVSAPLAYDSTADEVRTALMNIGAIKARAPRIAVYRRPNLLFGYTWTVEIEGMGDIVRFGLLRHTLVKSVIQYSNNFTTSTNQYIPCFAAGDPIATLTLRDGSDKYAKQERVMQIRNLQPQTSYQVRVYAIMNNGDTKLYSDAANLTTKKDTDRLLREQNLGLSTRRGDFQPELGPAMVAAGIGYIPAKQDDPHYVPGIGVGGSSGNSGTHGYCVAILHQARLEQPYSTRYFYYSGSVQSFTIPSTTGTEGTIDQITFKCWGAGGGGGKLSDLTSSPLSDRIKLSYGGGGAFAQVSVPVKENDVVSIIVGGGGRAPQGGFGGVGGYGGGGNGGIAQDYGGGGGGGASVVRISDALLLVAAGGGGGGSTDYCCAPGGSGGEEEGYPGGLSADKTPWPLSDLTNEVRTPLSRRFEYTSSACPLGIDGQTCISEWDIFPQSLPSEHKHLQYGNSPSSNYSAWAMPGLGGNQFQGGLPGQSGSFQVRTTGDYVITMSRGIAAVYSQVAGFPIISQGGAALRGGFGAGGKEGGGGGGGGLFGGGGGGSGIDGAGGGGGSSFYNSSMTVAGFTPNLNGEVMSLAITYIDHSMATIVWKSKWEQSIWGPPLSFVLEIAYGPYSDDWQYINSISSGIPRLQGENILVNAYNLTGLSPSTIYLFRVIPIFRYGRGRESEKILVKTLDTTINYWEPVIYRRQSLSRTARGFTNQVSERPHLTPGVQVFSSEANNDTMRYSDSPTQDTANFPSSRRGHSLTLIDDFVILFGGRTEGYECASVLVDTSDFGAMSSGRLVYPCVKGQSETSELWRFDIHSYEWIFINTTLWDSSPPPRREMHSASLINGDLYIFGGKSRLFPMDSKGLPIFVNHSDTVFNDLWKLDVEHPILLEFPFNPTPLAIPKTQPLLLSIDPRNAQYASVLNGVDIGDGVNAREGMCIDKVVVKVTIEHPCINQIRVSLYGPGPQTHSPNYHAHSSSHEVMLYNQRKTNGTGCSGGVHTFEFDDDATDLTEKCCRPNFVGRYKPDGMLAEFIGSSTQIDWTLVVQDMKGDSLAGFVKGWTLSTVVSPCARKYIWSKEVTIGTPPAARYNAMSIVHDNFMFIYGGRDKYDRPLSDLFRYNTALKTWDEMVPVDFNTALQIANSVGSNFVLSSWGLLRFGSLYRQPYLTSSQKYSQDNDVYVMDLSTKRWKLLTVSDWPQKSAIFGKVRPEFRYQSAMTFIDFNAVTWKKKFNYRNLFDQKIPSSLANYMSQLSHSLLLFGGHNGASGTAFDGSMGGMLNDMWILRFANFSTQLIMERNQQELNSLCEWRQKNTLTTSRPYSVATPQLGVQVLGIYNCLGAAGTVCDFRDLLLLAYCDGNFQSIL